jgi:NADH-quinone oxidoreductase subunit I
MCEFVCPPRAITIVAGDMPENKIEKYPEEFEINMLRCIYCGLCEEVCPEEAIFLTKNYEVAGRKRSELIFDKEKLLEIGGVREDSVMKWANK